MRAKVGDRRRSIQSAQCTVKSKRRRSHTSLIRGKWQSYTRAIVHSPWRWKLLNYSTAWKSNYKREEKKEKREGVRRWLQAHFHLCVRLIMCFVGRRYASEISSIFCPAFVCVCKRTYTSMSRLYMCLCPAQVRGRNLFDFCVFELIKIAIYNFFCCFIFFFVLHKEQYLLKVFNIKYFS